MANIPSQPPTSPASEPEPQHQQQHWCHQCEKRVSVETVANLPDVICHECKSGFVESIPFPPAAAASPSLTTPSDDPSFGSQFLQVLHLLAQSAREDDAPPFPPQGPELPPDSDYLRVELNGWDNDEDEEDENEENRELHDAFEVERDENEYDGGDREEADDEEEVRRMRREVLQLRIRDFATRGNSSRNRILDWADILMGLGDNSIELSIGVPQSNRYIGNPEDYVDAAGYEALLQNLAESDTGGRRGAPPAAKSAVSALRTEKIVSEEKAVLCAVCKDMVGVGEMVTNLPCGHGYHGNCILPWLGSRNSCPVCRFELPTDDAEYEEERKKSVSITGDGGSSSAGDAR